MPAVGTSRPVSPLYSYCSRVIYFYGVFRPLRGMVLQESQKQRGTRRGTSSDSRTRGRRRRYYAAFSLVSCSCRRYPPLRGRETPCPLNGVTGLPWLRGTPWNRRHRRAQRKAHLFWKNIIRTRARHEPPRSLLAGTCIPVYARVSPLCVAI